MSTVVVGEVPPERFALEHTFAELPDVRLECERVVDHGTGYALPLVWTHGANTGRMTRVVRQDPSVESVSLVAELGGMQLYQIKWEDTVRSLIDDVVDREGTVLEGQADATGWRFRLLYPDRGGVPFADGGRGNHFQIRRIGGMQDGPVFRYGLTEKQYATLRRGWELGYFDVPRTVGISELSESLGVTHQAVSERLRRAEATLIREALGLREHGEPLAA